MDEFFFKTLRKEKVSYPNYILNDHRAKDQMFALLQLNEVTTFYSKRGVIDCGFPEPNIYLTKVSNVNWNFEVFKMKKAILSNRKYTPCAGVIPSLTKFANQVFLLAMIYSRIDIIAYYFSKKIINVNQSMSYSLAWPSYFLFACTCSKAVVDFFEENRPKYSIGWNGLTPYLIAAYRDIELAYTSHLSYFIYRQYQLLLKFTGITINDTIEQFPMFPLDFACMNKDRNMMRSILQEIPETGILSKLSFIVQKEESLFLILSKYGFRPDQNFNGETPLHLSCATDDLCSMVILCNLGFEIRKNSKKKWCYEYGSSRTKEKSTVFFNLCSIKSANGSKKVFNQANFNEKMLQWLDILKFHPKDHEKYTGLFRYLSFNISNQILSKSRFSFFTNITISNAKSNVDNVLKKLYESVYFDRKYTDEEVLRAYTRIFY